MSYFVAKFGMFKHNLFSIQYNMLCLQSLMAKIPFCCCKNTLLWLYNQNVCSDLTFCFVQLTIFKNVCQVIELCMDYKQCGCSLLIIWFSFTFWIVKSERLFLLIDQSSAIKVVVINIFSSIWYSHCFVAIESWISTKLLFHLKRFVVRQQRNCF